MVVTGRVRRGVVAALVVYLAAVAAVTLRPEPAPDESFHAVRAALAWLRERGVGLTYEALEAVANVVMFVPFGVLVGLLLRRPWLAVALGAATSAVIELAQLAFLPSRVPTAQDVVMNTLGTVVGVAVLVLLTRRSRRGGGRGEGRGERRDRGRDDDGRALPQEDPAGARVEPV